MRPLLIILVVAVVGVMTAAALQPVTPTAACDPAPVSRLIRHERARVSLDDPRPLNMRDGPGTAFDVITQIPAGGVLYVVEGPSCSQNYAWYRVEYGGRDGWIAEGDSSGYYVEVYPPGW
ncbi:MAG: SH3 domain-containing protein [Anaerolineae bacterium]|nr:SH3 domain-containing protein [Anaerolineae bacterium]